jgi:hypothetical protein|nr:MAG TPA: hypothetical protein [Caudoviricetes sp.]
MSLNKQRKEIKMGTVVEEVLPRFGEEAEDNKQQDNDEE